MSMGKSTGNSTEKCTGKTWLRAVVYVSGMVLLAFGISLNKKTGLGVSPIVSVANAISEIWKLNFGNTTFGLYVSFVVVELLVHMGIRKREGWSSSQLCRILLLDLCLVPISLIFTRVLNLFEMVIPTFSEEMPGQFWGGMAGRLILLVIAVIATGVGVALILDAKWIPNPGDGIVQALADLFRKETGFMKNCFDCGCVTVTAVMSMLLAGHLLGLGIGTILAMIGVGRTIAVFNKFTKSSITMAVGTA